MPLEPFQKDITVVDGDSSYDSSAEVAALVQAATTFTSFSKIWELTVPAQQVYQWGYGNPNVGSGVNQGYMWFAAIDAGTGFEDGSVRLVMANATETRKFVIAELDSHGLHTATATNLLTARPLSNTDMRPLPVTVSGRKSVGEDSKLQIEWLVNEVTTTVDQCNFRIPATLYQ